MISFDTDFFVYDGKGLWRRYTAAEYYALPEVIAAGRERDELEALVNTGRRLMLKGELRAAIPILEGVMTRNADYGRSELAEVYLRLGDNADAIAVLSPLVDPTAPPAHPDVLMLSLATARQNRVFPGQRAYLQASLDHLGGQVEDADNLPTGESPRVLSFLTALALSGAYWGNGRTAANSDYFLFLADQILPDQPSAVLRMTAAQETNPVRARAAAAKIRRALPKARGMMKRALEDHLRLQNWAD